MRYAIEHIEYFNEKGETAFVGVFIDGEEFLMDKEDLWNLKCILETVFDRVIDTEGSGHPEVNRKVVKAQR